SSFDIDPDIGSTYLVNDGSQSAFIALFTSLGAYENSMSISVYGDPTSTGISVSGVEISSSGDITIVGNFSGDLALDPQSNTVHHSSSSSIGFIASYSSTFELQSSFTLPARITDMSTDGIGNTYLSGTFTESVDFDPGPGTHIYTSFGFGDMFFGKYS